MKHTYFLPILCAALLAACSSSATNPSPSPQDTTHVPTDSTDLLPAARQNYDSARGGVQITKIYYDQARNGSITGTTDEWAVIQTDRPQRIAGWTLDADDGQRFPLPDSIHSKLTVYTRSGPTNPQGEVLILHLNSWIWNNTTPDTARIFDSAGTERAKLSYIGT
ncbi:MAG TPA: lamin tail domain-containing protein [Candidatus Kapabacteria bacterium]|nr:lamin tail domain-containing protein [Candidatus Kapabacteria bacterium]